MNRTHTENPACSRKSFFAKLGGTMAAVGLAPVLFAKSTPAAKTAPVTVQPETRAVPRQSGNC